MTFGTAPGTATPLDERLEILQKVLLRERQLGYADRAALGGLDRFLQQWLQTAKGETGFSAPLPALPYRAMAPHERAAWVDSLLNVLGVSAPLLSKEGLGAVGAKPPPETPVPVPSKKPRKPAALLRPGQGLETPLEEVLRPDLAKLLAKLGAVTVRDLLYFFPRRHIDFSRTTLINAVRVGEDQTVVGTVIEAGTIQLGASPRNRAAEAVIGDGTGKVRAVWFNQPWIAATLKRGMRLALSGRVNEFRGRPVFENAEYEEAGEVESVHTARLVPVYPLTSGLSPRRMRSLMKRTVDGVAALVAEFLPPGMKRRQSLQDLTEALRNAHFPSSGESRDSARRRLAFDELLLIQIGVMQRKKAWKEQMPGHPLRPDPVLMEAFLAGLPFALTGAQRRVLHEVTTDMEKATAMSRIIQGEVGSGKTVIALAAALGAVSNGQQAAFMAPTELLADQHFRTVRSLLSGFEAMPLPGRQRELLAGARPTEALDSFTVIAAGGRRICTALLMGGTSRKRKQEIQQMAAQGEVDILVGTHALFQKDVEFSDLGLAIVDEQHRFGVMQRKELRQKGHNPHLLVMTATPIPRSLALTLYGDLDISVIDELPPGRLPIKTRWLDASRRDSAYRFIAREVEAGRQAFIVYPLVEESEKLDVAAATEEHVRLSHDVFADLRLGLLHGRMKQQDKDEVMRAFRARDLDILVSTSVVEVGIDIPNATVMMIDWADRFGLAQLHQFRGRVGRGQHQSYCILVSHEPSATASERLSILERVNDGFVLAEEDLKLRGAGEFFGTKQSGIPDLRMARISDRELLEAARDEAALLFSEDADLGKPAHRALAEEVVRAWQHRTLVIGEA